MTDPDLIAALAPFEVAAVTAYGEARNQGRVGRHAVLSTVGNRVKAQRKHYGLNPKDVCLKPWQYSCWMPEGGRANFELVMAVVRSLIRKESLGPVMRECLALGAALSAGTLDDIVQGSCHYLTRDLYRSEFCPKWAKGRTPTCEVGDHLFFAGVD